MYGYQPQVRSVMTATVGGGGTIAVGQHAKGTGNTTSVTAAITTAATGSTFIGVMIFGGTRTFSSINDSFSNAYTQIGSEQNSGGSGTPSKLRVYYKENGAGGAGHTLTGVTDGGVVTMFLLEITGAAAASFDSGSVAQVIDGTSPFEVTSNTLAQAAELVIAAIAGDASAGTATLAESSGFIIQEKEEDAVNFFVGGIATKIVSATTALTPSFTQTNSTSTALTVAGFKQ